MSNLLNRSTTLPVYREAGGMKYPWMEDATKLLMDMFWKFDAIELGKDVEDYAKGSKKERGDIQEIMKLFTQNEVNICLLAV